MTDTEAIDALVATLYGEGSEDWDSDTFDQIAVILAQVRELPNDD